MIVRRIRILLGSVVAVAWLHWVVIPAADAQDSELVARLESAVGEELASSATHGASVAVFDSHGTIAAFGVGDADWEAAIPAAADTIYLAASVSKLLTATLVMHEVERGKLSLDEDVNASLEPRRRITNPAGLPVAVTLRQLLSHTSGIPTALLRGLAWPDSGVNALDAYLADGLVAVRQPGEKLVYSNDAYALAGWISAQAEAETFADHARRILLVPLDMTKSSFDPSTLAGTFAAGYGPYPGSDSRTEIPSLAAVAPAGALRSTVLDLSRFGRMLLRGGELDGQRVLSAESIDEMWRVQSRVAPQQPEGFGLGFNILERGDRTRVWWDGLGAGATARLALWPAHDLGVAILANHTDPSTVAAISERVETLLLGPYSEQSQAFTVDSARAVSGEWVPLDLLDPALWFIVPLTDVKVAISGQTAEFKMLGWSARSVMTPLTNDRFRVHGSLFDGYTATLSDGRLYVGWLEFRRPAWYESTAMWFAYVGALIVVLIALIFAMTRVAFRFVRRSDH